MANPAVTPGQVPWTIALRQNDPKSFLRSFMDIERRFNELAEVHILFTIAGAVSAAIYDPPYHPTFPGEILGVRVNAGDAPTDTATFDLLVDGTSIFTTSAKPTVLVGAFYGEEASVEDTDTNAFAADAKLQVECETPNGIGEVVVAIRARKLPKRDDL